MRCSVMTVVSGIDSLCSKVNTRNHLQTTKPKADVLAHMKQGINIQSKIRKEIKRLLLTKRSHCLHHPGKVKRQEVKQTAGKTGQIIYQARVEDCLDGRSHRYQLACRQSKRKDRQSNVHLHREAVLLEPREEVQCHRGRTCATSIPKSPCLPSATCAK